MRMMMDPSLKQNRLGWLSKGRKTLAGTVRDQGEAPGQPQMPNMMNDTLAVSDKSDTLFFVGCAPYFTVQFGQIGVNGNRVSRATVQLLNALGIEPQVLADERCCGHDLLWEGDVEGFETLAQLNAELIRQSGATRIVTSCPECARALKVDYAAHGFDLGVEVLHLTELLAQEDWSGTRFKPLRGAHSAEDDSSSHTVRRVTFQDPCRLGRHLGIYDAPRQAIQALGFELIEMPRHKENALCCGTNGWTHCGAANRQIQGDRLSEAQATGADVLVTACLKCQIHLKCALQDRQLGTRVTIEIKDLATLMADSLRYVDPVQQTNRHAGVRAEGLG
jgi:Fe-S oxidoreductase